MTGHTIDLLTYVCMYGLLARTVVVENRKHQYFTSSEKLDAFIEKALQSVLVVLLVYIQLSTELSLIHQS